MRLDPDKLSQARRSMSCLDKKGAQDLMDRMCKLEEYIEAGNQRLREISQEEACAMHNEVLAETRAMHGQIQRVEHWGIGIAVFLGIFSMLDFFGCSYKSSTSQTIETEPAIQSLAAPSASSKNQKQGTEDTATPPPAAPAETPTATAK